MQPDMKLFQFIVESGILDSGSVLNEFMATQTENELLDKLVTLYFSNSHIDKLTFHGLYEKWLDYKASVTDKTILNGMYSYAIRKKYLTENPMTHVEIRTRFRQVVRKTGKTQTFNTEEQQLLCGRAYQDEP